VNTKTKNTTFFVSYIVKKLWAIFALSLVVVAVSLSIVRYSLPYMNEQKHHLENWLSERVGTELSIGEITAKWQGIGPAIVLRDVQLAANIQSPLNLSISETAIEVDFWQSVLAWQIQANKFDLRRMEVTLNLASLGQEETEYPIIEAMEKLFLQQLQLFSISESKIVINTINNQQQVVLIDQVSWVNKDEHHQGVGQLQIEEIAKNSSSFVLDLYGKQDNLHGTFFAKGEEIDLSPWIQQWIASDYTLLESRGSFIMWATIADKALKSVQLDVSNSRFNWQSPEDQSPTRNLELAVLGGQINANPLAGEWIFNLNNLTMQINDNVLVTDWLGKIDSAGTLLLQHNQPTNLAPLLPMLALVLEPKQNALLNALQLQATLNSLQVQHTLDGDLAIQASIRDTQWQQTGSIPGMAGIFTELSWFNTNGNLHIKSKAGQLTIDNLLPTNIEYQRFYADLSIQSHNGKMNILVDNALLKSDLISLHPSLFYQSENNFLALSSNIGAIDVSRLSELYPEQLMGTGTKNYLTESLQQGQIDGAQIIWHGPVGQFPFTKQQGVFQAGIQISDGQLKFSPEWPALTQFSVDLLFENDGLTMTSQKGSLLDVELTNLIANIPTLDANAILTIDANAQAQGQQVTDLMLQSSLAETLGKTLQQVQVAGLLSTQLNLHIPMTGEGLVASGQVQLSNNQVTLPNLALELQQANGRVKFTNDKISASDLTANLLQQPVQLGLTGLQQEQGYQVDISATGDWQIAPLLDISANKGLANYLTGNTNWQADIALTLPEEGYQYSAKIFSDLRQLSSNLPTPFTKASEPALPLLVTSQGNQQASSIKVTLGDQVEFNGNLPHQDMQFSRAHLAIGQSDLMGMGLGFSVSANLAELDATPWYDVINSLIADLPTNDKPLIGAPKRIFINADTAFIASQRLTDLEMVVKNTTDSWLFDINAKQARMEVAMYKDWLNKGVNINADFIELDKWQSADAQDTTNQSNSIEFEADIDTLPPVAFSCSRCRFLENDLGKIDFNLSRSATGMKIDSLRFNNAYGLFYGSGDWFLADGQSSTRLKGEFSSSNFGAFLDGFNFNSGIKDSKASSTFDLSWQRAPYEFNFESLNGQIEWRLTDGYLTEVSDQGSRIFSLLSLESLVRKLQLDFRDMFAKGFFYDKINGSFQLENGIAYTKDTLVDGGAGEIGMQGFTDLSAQQLQYQIEFTPNVTSSLPVIIAWMVNPATALAAVALDQMLTSAKVISNIKFSLTGTFDDPQLTELGRDSKEVILPARVRPEQDTQPSQSIETPAPQTATETPVSG
jgi:uncharacterized protein (TIGR02099 family)